MTGTRRPELTPGQIACLELVNQHFTSKEIARKLDISPFTVDQRLDAARRKLNAPSRKDAAKLFAAMQREAVSEPLVYEPATLAPIQPTAIFELSAGGTSEPNASGFNRFSIPPVGGKRHGLSTKEILLQSINIAFLGSLMVFMIIIIMMGAMKLFS